MVFCEKLVCCTNRYNSTVFLLKSKKNNVALFTRHLQLSLISAFIGERLIDIMSDKFTRPIKLFPKVLEVLVLTLEDVCQSLGA